jgi:hypothetical protein
MIDPDAIRFFLGRSLDMSIIGTLDAAKGKNVTIDNNKSGAAGFTLRLDHPLAQQLTPWYNCLIVQRGDDWLWSGPFTQATYDLAAGQVQVNALGWFEVLLPRLIQAEFQLVNLDAAIIARTLLETANAQRQTGITFGTYELSKARTRTFARDSSIGQEIQGLGELESGYDWLIDPKTRRLNIMERRGIDNPGVKWFYIHDSETGMSNCKNVVATVDGSTVINDIKPRGAAAFGHAFDTPSQEIYGLRHEAPSLSDVKNSTILQAYAEAEIIYRKHPRITFQINPKSARVANVPTVFRDFDIGDTTYLTARRDNYKINNQAVRIFGVDIGVNDDGSYILNRVQTANA